MTRATILAICFLALGTVLLIWGLVHACSGKGSEFNQRADRAMIVMLFGGLFAAFGTIIGIIQIIRHLIR